MLPATLPTATSVWLATGPVSLPLADSMPWKQGINYDMEYARFSKGQLLRGGTVP